MKKIGIFVALFAFGLSLNAQSSKVTAAWSKMNAYNEFGRLDPGDLIKAKELIDEAVEHEKSGLMPKAHLYKGQIYQLLSETKDAELATGATAVAMEAYQKAIDLEEAEGKKKKYSKDALQGILGLSPGFYNDGLNCYNAQDYDCAYTNFNQVVEVSRLALANKVEGAAIDTGAISASAFSADRAGKKDEAKRLYSELIDLEYNDPSIYLGLARLTEGEEAKKYITDGLERFPDDKALNIEKVNSLLSGGDQQEAIKSMEEAIAVDPTNSSLYFALGVAYDSQKNTAKAIESYEKAIELQPDYFNAYYNLGAVFYNQAAEKSKEMNDLPIDDQKGYDRLKGETDVLFKQGLPHLETAHELNPTDLLTVIALKEIYARTNNLEKMSEMKNLYDKLSAEK